MRKLARYVHAVAVCLVLVTVCAIERVEAQQGATKTRGERWAVVVGISQYRDSAHIQNLRYADRDAQSFHDFLRSERSGAGGFAADHVQLLLNEQATYENIRYALRSFLKSATPEDEVIIYFAGHGAPDPERLEDLYLLVHDTRGENIASTGVPMTDFTEAMRKLFARHLLIIVDACHSAGAGGQTFRAGTLENRINQAFLARLESAVPSRAVITASGALQLSQEDTRWGGGHGVFTYHLLQALDGAGDENKDGLVTLQETFEYVRSSVRRETRNAQIPTISQSQYDGALPLAVLSREPRAATPGAPVAPAAPAPSSPVRSNAASVDGAGATSAITGCWNWKELAVVGFQADNTVTRTFAGTRWFWIGGDQYSVHWPAPVYSMRLSSDGLSLSGLDNYGTAINATRSAKGEFNVGSPVGDWKLGTIPMSFAADGSATVGALRGQWSALGGQTVRAEWPDAAPLDRLTLSSDGSRLSGRNQMGIETTARRVACQ